MNSSESVARDRGATIVGLIAAIPSGGGALLPGLSCMLARLCGIAGFREYGNE